MHDGVKALNSDWNALKKKAWLPLVSWDRCHLSVTDWRLFRPPGPASVSRAGLYFAAVLFSFFFFDTGTYRWPQSGNRGPHFHYISFIRLLFPPYSSSVQIKSLLLNNLFNLLKNRLSDDYCRIHRKTRGVSAAAPAAWARGLSPPNVAYPHRETYWSRIRRWTVRNCRYFDGLCGQNLSTVSANCFSFLGLRPSDARPHWGIPFTRPLSCSPPLNKNS